MDVVASFLRVPKRFRISLPDRYSARPLAKSTINAFGGVRTVAYAPEEFVEDPTFARLRHRYDTVIHGIPVSVYEREEPPVMFTAVWRLRSGVVTTFMDEPTATVEALEAIMRDLTVTGTDDNVPRVQLPSFPPGDPRDDTFRDVLTFTPRNDGLGGNPIVRLSPALRTTRTDWMATEGEHVIAHKTVDAGISLSVSGPNTMVPELERLRNSIARSIEPA